MKFIYSDRYIMDLEGHVFPVEKYKRIIEKLLSLGLIGEEDIVEPEMPTLNELGLVHYPEYLDDLINLRWTSRTLRSEMALNRSIVEGFFLMAGGTYLASIHALGEGASYHVGGGFHHAYPDHAEGFCYINDIAFAIKKLLKEERIERAAVVDCDLHQGNGTAYIFRNEERVFTFSIHEEDIYPVPKERSDLDIGLPPMTEDEEYLSKLEEALRVVYDEHKPEFVIYQAGADPFREDTLGYLLLSKDGLKKRDELVIEGALKRGIKVTVTLGGGYARRLEDTVEIHVNTAKVALEAVRRYR